jgi:hypothetical protein
MLIYQRVWFILRLFNAAASTAEVIPSNNGKDDSKFSRVPNHHTVSARRGVEETLLTSLTLAHEGGQVHTAAAFTPEPSVSTGYVPVVR